MTTLNLDHLDTTVENTLQAFQQIEKFPKIDVNDFDTPITVVGSGNGLETGKIIFRKHPAFFASESEASDKISQSSSVVIVSASGEKHAPILALTAKTSGKIVHLISSTQGSSASKIADHAYLFPKITEPYTYNTSTYFAYIYGSEQGAYDLKDVENFISGPLQHALQLQHLGMYDSFFVVLPNEFALLRNMIDTKFVELFGRQVARDVATYDQVKHAMTLVPGKEMFLCFGNDDNTVYSERQINLPIFDREHYGPMMLAAYWTVGQIQRQLPAYFMEHVDDYCKNSEYTISPIVQA